MAQIKCYAVAIDNSDFIFNCIQQPKRRQNEILDAIGTEKNGFVGVNLSTSFTTQFLLYDSKSHRDTAFYRLRDYFKSAAIVANPAFVDERYLNQNSNTDGGFIIMLNNLSIAGRLTRDPELKLTTTGNVPVCRFSIAVDRSTANEKITDFFNCVTWRKNAEFVSKYFHKGDLIILTGRIEQIEYTDKNNVTKKDVQINVFTADFGGGRNGANNSPSNGSNASGGKSGANNSMPENDGELPFEV